ncbi:DUF1572 family protein [Alkalihalophilus lindianensis]|uniref:DUF1572 family protein n=1 Tax=Alkalihalophilus lindianensis TaxID=1630542 RepID=A0ABU3X4U9_9BACI|nr:DUF1572 family protein [Alkalihalophilus lindianensis]MDV2682906.1 DUF1572 family protein [Alkalihalophilus lindianensis]
MKQTQGADFSSEYVRVVTSRFLEMKKTAEKAFEQVEEDFLCWSPNEESNSIAVIVQHMSGNMISRWTDFLTTDGEKKERNRDQEFINTIENKEQLYEVWNRGWGVLFHALKDLKEEELLHTVFIRNEPHTVIEAIERQMYHYSYHTGQIVYITKQVAGEEWTSLTIPKKKSKDL